MRIVLVDDDVALCRHLTEALAARGCDALVAHSYEAGLQLVRDTSDLGVLYLAERLPRLSGADLLAELERDGCFARLAVVVRVEQHESLLAFALRHGGLQTVLTASEPDELVSTICLATVRNRRQREHEARARQHAHSLWGRAHLNRARARALGESTARLIGTTVSLRARARKAAANALARLRARRAPPKSE